MRLPGPVTLSDGLVAEIEEDRWVPGSIVLTVDEPLEHFGGRTAYEVAWAAMMYHESQLVYDHRPTLYSEDFPRYDCRRFGLVRTRVGVDTGNDIMEHLNY